MSNANARGGVLSLAVVSSTIIRIKINAELQKRLTAVVQTP